MRIVSRPASSVQTRSMLSWKGEPPCPARRARRLQQLRLAPLAGLHRLDQPAADHQPASRGRQRRSAVPTSARRRRCRAPSCRRRPTLRAGAGLCLGRAAALHAAIQRRHGMPTPIGSLPSSVGAPPLRRGAPTTLGAAGGPHQRHGPAARISSQSGDTAWNISQRYGDLGRAARGRQWRLDRHQARPADWRSRLRAAARRSAAGAGGRAARQRRPAGHRRRRAPPAQMPAGAGRGRRGLDAARSRRPQQQLALAPQTGAAGALAPAAAAAVRSRRSFAASAGRCAAASSPASARSPTASATTASTSPCRKAPR